MKLSKQDKWGLGLMLLSLPFFFGALFWSPLMIPGLILVVMGYLLWDPTGFWF